MKLRAEPIEVHERDPWACVAYASAPPIWLKRPGIRDCGSLSTWLAQVGQERREAAVALRAAADGGPPVDAVALLNSILEADAAMTGAVLGALWSDPLRELDARLLRAEGAYSDVRQPHQPEGFRPSALLPTHDVDGQPIVRPTDPRAAFGLDVHAELIEAGYSHGQLEAAATRAVVWIRSPLGSMGHDVDHGEWRDFSAAQTAPSGSPSST